MKQKGINRKIYIQESTKKYMQTHLDIPEYINRKIKYEKLERNLSTIQETVIAILNEYFKNKNY